MVGLKIRTSVKKHWPYNGPYGGTRCPLGAQRGLVPVHLLLLHMLSE